ncbi:MAG: tRNA (adenosine(37)-N6)-threonylcarbamoyltransferase complex dimerization subunit type 1 TsaB [Chitinophagaceae bacterium]
MSYILHINTALEVASISIAMNGTVLLERQNGVQKEHASFLHLAIAEIMQETGITLKNIDAVAVIHGPGSYTGLRVGLAGAKGICFALSVPLITVNTLEWMAGACKNEEADLFCPMIDARRMEVFTALYNAGLEEISPPASLILQPESFINELETKKIIFFGNGAKKFSTILSHKNARFPTLFPGADEFASISWKRYQKGSFAELVYAEPLYVKAFFTPVKN